MRYIIYDKIIGDGDPSVMKKLTLAKSYGPDVLIKKIECSNHLLRNYCSRIIDISTRIKSSSGSVVPGILRKILKNKY